MVFLWDFHGISMGLLWYFRSPIACLYLLNDISMIFHCFLRGFYMGCPRRNFELSMGVLRYFRKISIGFVWGFHGISKGLQEKIYGTSPGISMGFEAIVCGISIGIVWKFYGILWYFHKISLGFHDISIGSPSDICGVAFLWDFQICFYDLSMGLSMGIMWDYSRISLCFVCDVHVVSVIFLWGFCGIPMGFPWYAYDISLGLVRDVNCKSVEKLDPVENHFAVD